MAFRDLSSPRTILDGHGGRFLILSDSMRYLVEL